MEPEEETISVGLDIRSQLMISRALKVAMESLAKENHPPTSDIATMEYLYNVKFPLWKAVEMNDITRQDLEKLNSLGLTLQRVEDEQHDSV